MAPIHYAAAQNRAPTVELLILKGVDVNVKDKSELLRMHLMMMAMTIGSINMIAIAFAFTLCCGLGLHWIWDRELFCCL